MTQTPPPTRVRFLAPATHPEDPTIVYGPGHVMEITDPAVVNSFSQRGMIEILSSESPSPPPTLEITNVSVFPGSTDAQLTWTTSVDADGVVNYGADSSYGSSVTEESPPTQNHIVTLSGLTAETAYHYSVSSTPQGGSAVTSPDATFTTTAVTGG